MLARIPITEAQIAQVVSAFYARVRAHPHLGPIFATHVRDWPTHEAKIARFWGGALLRAPGYDGNPMQVHKSAGNVTPEDFEPWLALFDQVLEEELSEDLARGWSMLAHRIGDGLRFGLEPARNGGVPRI